MRVLRKSFMVKKIVLVLVFVLFATIGFYFWATSGEYHSDEERYPVYSILNTSKIEKDTLSIMTFNIGYLSGMTNNKAVKRQEEFFDANAKTLVQLLDKESIDILAIQEIDFGSSRSFGVDQLRFILKEGKFYFGAKALNWDKRYVPFPYWPLNVQFGKVLSGQAVASKFPIVSNAIEVLDKPIDQPFYYKDFYLDRLIQINKLLIGDKELTVMNIHLEAFSQKTRAIHIKKVLQKFEQLASQGPTILLGDFNEALQPQEQSLMTPFYQHSNFGHAIRVAPHSDSAKQDFTYSAEHPKVKIDYIFYSSDFIDIIEAKTITETNLLSDHLPVMMRFQLRNSN